jgi:hypothetical protein
MSSSVLAAILIPIAVAMALAMWIFFALSSRPLPDSSYGTVRPAEDDRKVSTPAARDEPLTPTRRDTVRPAVTPVAAELSQDAPESPGRRGRPAQPAPGCPAAAWVELSRQRPGGYSACQRAGL